jgi:alcohol dehydrogenase class IV
MINSLLSSTKFLSFEKMTSEDLVSIVYCLGCGFDKAKPRVALIKDKRPSDAVWELEEGLSAHYDVVMLDRVQQDPRAADITAMVSECDIENVNLVIGIGGGSVMDSAKALAMLAENGGNLEDYLGPNPRRTIQRKGLPLLLVPTTAGTGSEATKVGVYTAPSGRKFTLGSPFLQADAAVLSGALAATMPPSLTASTGFDALSHALESIWNKNATPLTLDAAIRAATMVLRALPHAYQASLTKAQGFQVCDADNSTISNYFLEDNKSHNENQSVNAVFLKMLEAATSAGIAFSITGTALVHALSFVLSEDWHIPHGAACAFTLDDAYRLQARDRRVKASLEILANHVLSPRNQETDKDRQYLQSDDPVEQLIAHIVGLKTAMKLPSTFGDLGIEIDREQIKKRFERAFDDPKMANSMPQVTQDEIYALLEAKL